MRARAPTSVDSGRATRLLLACGVVAPFVFAAFVIGAWLVTPDYSHIKDAVSQLGAQGRPHSEVMNAGFGVYGLLIIGLAQGMRRRLGRVPGAQAAWLLLTLYGIAVLFSGIFQDGPRGVRATANLEDVLHSVFAQLSFFALVLGMLSTARATCHDSSWRGFVVMTLAVVVLDLCLGLLFMMEFLQGIEGALQRASMAVSLIWIEATALRLLRASPAPLVAAS